MSRLRLDTNAFTLLEMVLVIGLILIVTAVGAPLYMSSNRGNQLEAATNILAQDLYQAQSYSRNAAQDLPWGVAINGQNITLFSGTSYAARNPANDITYTMPNDIQKSGVNEVVFSKRYGLPVSAGAFTLTVGNSSKTVTVNNKGMVEY